MAAANAHHRCGAVNLHSKVLFISMVLELSSAIGESLGNGEHLSLEAYKYKWI